MTELSAGRSLHNVASLLCVVRGVKLSVLTLKIRCHVHVMRLLKWLSGA